MCDPHLLGSCKAGFRCRIVDFHLGSNTIVFIARRLGSKNARSGALTDVIRGSVVGRFAKLRIDQCYR